ncbi:MAG: glutamine-hydrolyzing GMP synthase, partial [Candidatus Omnitrophica bacterium]|nr:glutamine-hydrolyzing GMP synthase [Candidatus Omnitrophota bacterium]
MADLYKEAVTILDFGSQYTQLIARRIRECKVYCEILPYNIDIGILRKNLPKGVVLSGGPASLTFKKSPVCSSAIFDLGIPILGICYGMQLEGKFLGGEVSKAHRREYGYAELMQKVKNKLFLGLPNKFSVWMSHGDKIIKLPKGFKIIGSTENSPIAAIANEKKKIYGVQFHPEVIHTFYGKKIFENFLYHICDCPKKWNMKSFIEQSIAEIVKTVGNERVVCALSGGVDSSVLAVLLHKAVKKKLICIFVDNGLLRKGERASVIKRFKNYYRINLKVVDAENAFLNKLRNVTDHEKNRKLIGNEFIRVFEREAKKVGRAGRAGRVKFLAQGTLYPDLIESRSAFGGPSATIKTHHNVGGLPAKMKLKLLLLQ